MTMNVTDLSEGDSFEGQISGKTYVVRAIGDDTITLGIDGEKREYQLRNVQEALDAETIVVS